MMTSTCSRSRVRRRRSLTGCKAGSFFFEHVNDSGGTDAQDADDIANPTPIEGHVHDLPFDLRPSPLVLVLHEKDAPHTGGVVTAIALGAIGLLPVFHHIGALTRWTLHVHKSHNTFPLKNRDGCAPHDITPSTEVKHHPRDHPAPLAPPGPAPA